METVSELTIAPEYLKKAREFSDLKRNFQKWIELLDNTDYLSVEDSLKVFNDLGMSFPRLLAPQTSYPLKLYRTRVIPKNSREDIANPKTFSYPPAKNAMSYQRANAPGFPVFYGALDGATALEELRINGLNPIKKGDTVYLSEWNIKNDAIFNFCYLTIPQIVDKDQLYSDLTKNVYSEIVRIFSNEDFFVSKTQQYLYEKMSNLFLNGKYIQSGIIAHEIIYNTPEVNGIKIHGIIYPSCANNFRSVNCALHPDFVDNQLVLEQVRKVSFEEFVDGGAKGYGSYFGEMSKGRIKWRTYMSQLFTNHFSIEVALDKEWDIQDVQNAKFILDKQEKDLKKYCSEKVNKINLSGGRVAEGNEKYYRENTMFYYVKDLNLRKGFGYLKLGDMENEISVIRIKIPLKTFTSMFLQERYNLNIWRNTKHYI